MYRAGRTTTSGDDGVEEFWVGFWGNSHIVPSMSWNSFEGVSKLRENISVFEGVVTLSTLRISVRGAILSWAGDKTSAKIIHITPVIATVF